MACGPPSADMRIGIVMKGPIPIMFDMLRAVACSRPKRRERETLIVRPERADGLGTGRLGAALASPSAGGDAQNICPGEQAIER